MTTNPFKSCIPYHLSGDFARSLRNVADNLDHAFHEALAQYTPRDPDGGRWMTSGVCKTRAGEELITPLSGDIVLMAVQFNERILPGKVRDEHVKKKVAVIEEREARRVHRKEYAQIREDVEFELLPQAFIRRSQVYVSFLRDRELMLIHTSSAKRADDAYVLLARAFQDFPVPFEPTLIAPKSPTGTLTRIAREGLVGIFDPTASAVFKGQDGQTIRIKDLDVGSQHIRDLFEQDYDVHELGLCSYDGEGSDLYFNVTNKFVFKGIDLPDVKLQSKYADEEVAREEFQGYALAALSYLGQAVRELLQEMDGDLNREGQEVDEDDEL